MTAWRLARICAPSGVCRTTGARTTETSARSGTARRLGSRRQRALRERAAARRRGRASDALTRRGRGVHRRAQGGSRAASSRQSAGLGAAALSLGAGHLWRSCPHPLGGDPAVWGLSCARCGACVTACTRAVRRVYARPRRGRTMSLGAWRTRQGPIGTCKAGSFAAQRRAMGEAETRAALERFE